MHVLKCDKCGDVGQGDNAPGLQCGRVEPESWPGPCTGTYRKAEPESLDWTCEECPRPAAVITYNLRYLCRVHRL